MPITIFPPANGLLGPGCVVSGGTNILDEVTQDWHWQLELRLQDALETLIFYTTRTATAGRDFTVELGAVSNTLQQGGSLSSVAVPENTDIRVVARLFDPANVERESLSIPTKYSAQAGIHITQLDKATQVTGGFTATDRTEAAETQLAATIPLTGTGLATFIAQAANALQNPGYFFTCVTQQEQPLTGQGTLTPPERPIHNLVLGLTWFFNRVPPGAGRRNGFVPVYSGRVLQLVAAYQLNHNTGSFIHGEVT